jgi:hypothetical protein
VQRYELNRGRPEARSLINFDATAQQVCFPAVEQAARLRRFIERKSNPKRPQGKPAEIETEWLLSSRPRPLFSAEQIFDADRWYGVSRMDCICAWMSRRAKTAVACAIRCRF